jgi:hypothetical protein
VLPNFLIIGAARSGTSTLYAYLRSHPDIYLRESKRPEPHFFFKPSEYAKGLGYYEEKWFPREGKWRAVGEASTSYLCGPDVPALIARDLPGVHLIAILRNPIDRAYSNYWHGVRSGIETLDFGTAVDQEAERTQAIEGTPLGELKPYSYIARGFYFAQLSNYLRFFDRDRLTILTFEQLREAPRALLDGLYRQLGVDPGHLPPRLDLVENRSAPEGAKMDPSLRRRLADIYAEDVGRLGKLLDQDLTTWLA